MTSTTDTTMEAIVAAAIVCDMNDGEQVIMFSGTLERLLLARRTAGAA